MIYFVQAEDGGPIKIGRTTDLRKRMASFRCVSPKPLRVVAVMAGSHATESRLHQKFAAHRLNGEWFAPADDLTLYILENGLEWDGTADQFRSIPTELPIMEEESEEPVTEAVESKSTVRIAELVSMLRRFVETGEALNTARERCHRNAPYIFQQARSDLALSQRELADLLGVHHTYMSQIETGHAKPGHPVLEKLHQLLEERDAR